MIKQLKIDNNTINLEEDTLECIKKGVCEYCHAGEVTNLFSLGLVGRVVIRNICDNCYVLYRDFGFVPLTINELFMLRLLMEE